MEVRSPFLQLPAELVQYILTHLSAFDLGNTARTCRFLLAHSYDDQVWLPVINKHVPHPISLASSKASLRQVYLAHTPYWFVPEHVIWFADTEPSGKLLIARFNAGDGSIQAHAVTAQRRSTRFPHEFWAHDPAVAIINFDPQVSLDLNQPVVNLAVDSPRTDDRSNGYPSDRDYAPPSIYSKEILMNTFAEAGLFSSFTLCRKLPPIACHEGTRLWPPLRFPSVDRARNETSDGFHSAGHRPNRLSEVSHSNFRLRKWVEYTGRRSNPSTVSFSSPNGLSATLGISGPYFASGFSSTSAGGMNIRMPEDITTYATLPRTAYTPTRQKPWQGIWVGDYGGHGCEFLLMTQPDRGEERPLPEGLDWLREWFLGGRRGSASSSSSYASAQEMVDGPADDQSTTGATVAAASSKHDQANGPVRPDVDYHDAPTGRLEAIKLTGDPNIPRGEYTFVAPDIGHGGFVRVADEEPFRGARVVRSAGHIAANGFREDQYTPSQLIMISHDRLAQFWEGFGHISFFHRVDLDALVAEYTS